VTDAPPLTRAIVLDQRLPAPRLVDRVEVRRITLAPDSAVGPHTHNGPVFGCVETGSAIYQVEGGAETVLTAGDVFYEPEGVRVERFDSRSDGVTFVAYFPVGPGEEPRLDLIGAG
jgi:quercetin dioxygenase-like cupin family protein